MHVGTVPSPPSNQTPPRNANVNSMIMIELTTVNSIIIIEFTFALRGAWATGPVTQGAETERELKLSVRPASPMKGQGFSEMGLENHPFLSRFHHKRDDQILLGSGGARHHETFPRLGGKSKKRAHEFNVVSQLGESLRKYCFESWA